MAVFRVEKNKDYTIMSNHHLRNMNLSMKAKGLLSLMLSLPENWDYTLGGLASICKDGIASIRAAVVELEENGYLTRARIRNEKGQLTDTEYTIRESPFFAPPVCEKPMVVSPALEKPTSENPTQLSINKSSIDISSKDQSIYPAKPDEAVSPQKDRWIDKIGEVAAYRELIQANIEYDCLCVQYGTERVDEIVEIMLDAICSQRPHLRVGGEDKPAELVKSRLLKIDQFHMEYAFDCLNKNTMKIHNIRAYILATLYNAPTTIDHYYRAEVQHDMYGGG